MSINSLITDADNGQKAQVLKKDGYQGLHVINSDLKEFKNVSSFFINPTYGSNMNRNFANVISTENVHNGGDNTYWTATTIVGNVNDFDFNSTDIAYEGAQSIDCTSSEGGDQFQLANDTELNDDDYDLFRGGIYVTGAGGLPDDGVEIIFYNTNTGLQVSTNSVDLDDYIDGTNTDVGQRFSIPLVDFGLFTDNFDAMRFTILEDDAPPNFYLDDLALEKLNEEPAIFSVKPPKGTGWHVQGLGIAMAKAYDPTLTDSTMPKIPYTGLLGTPLTNGTTYQRSEDGEIQFSFIINDLIDILNQYDTRISSYGSDGTNTFLKIDIDFRTPFVLKAEFEDFISFQFTDDLSAMKYLRIVADAKEENRNRSGEEYDFRG